MDDDVDLCGNETAGTFSGRPISDRRLGFVRGLFFSGFFFLLPTAPWRAAKGLGAGASGGRRGGGEEGNGSGRVRGVRLGRSAAG